MVEHIHLIDKVPQHLSGKRLDQVAAELFSMHSRSMLKRWIEEGVLTVNQCKKRPKDKVFASDKIELQTTLPKKTDFGAEAIQLNVVFEDEHLLIINKPAGLVVHPAAGNASGTLLNGLLFAYPFLETLPRSGIVHRLDKDTSGLMAVAKTLSAHTSLVAQLQARTVKRQYTSVVIGLLTAGGTVDAPIGRHPKNRLKMAVISNGKAAVTHYRVIHRFRAHTQIKLNLQTGRTHQIRVHMSHLHYPLVGDATYGYRKILPKGPSAKLQEVLTRFKRQALHAERLGLIHPHSEEYIEWTSTPPKDFIELVEVLKEDTMQKNFADDE